MHLYQSRIEMLGIDEFQQLFGTLILEKADAFAKQHGNDGKNDLIDQFGFEQSMNKLGTAIDEDVFAFCFSKLIDQCFRTSGMKRGIFHVGAWSSCNDVRFFIGMYEFRNMRRDPVVSFAAEYDRIYRLDEFRIPVVFSFFGYKGKKIKIVAGFRDVAVEARGNVQDGFSAHITKMGKKVEVVNDR